MKQVLYVMMLICIMSGCHDKRDIGEITLARDRINKKQYKTHEQFIQIAYIDLFNRTIEPQRLSNAKHIFDSQGDDDLSYKLFVRQLIDEAGPKIPSDSILKKDPEKFVIQSYLRFFGRYPGGYEKKILIDDINNDKSVTGGKIYYILMTTEEYRMF